MKLYTGKVVADWLALTERRVRQLRDEGVINERSPGLYDMKATVTRYILFLRKGSGKDLNDERALLTKAKREAADMENEVRRGNLHTTEDVEKGIKAICLNFKARMTTIPAKLSGELAQLGGNQAAIFDRLKETIDEALEELSDANVALAIQGEDEDEEPEAEGMDS